MTAKTTVQELPLLPGVYLFKNPGGTVLYIGKAKSLRKRVASYFAKQDNDWKINALIEEHATIEHIVTHSEHEALLLEAQLVKEYQPKYNTLLKSGNPFLYLVFTQPSLHPSTPLRMSEKKSHPPAHGEPVESMQRHSYGGLQIVRTRKIKGDYYGPFIHKREARGVYDYLMRTFKLTRCNLSIANGCLDYHLGRCAGNCMPNFNEEDYKIRLQLAQQTLDGNAKEFLKIIQQQVQEYSKQLDFEKAQRLNEYAKNLDAIFATLKTKFTDRKYKKEVAHVIMPERIAIKKQEALEALTELQHLLGLPAMPNTIDCFDISHFQSSYIVGSCVRFTNGIPEKNKFRRFKIKTLTEQNDYAALQEIVTRRYRDPKELPDIVLIDGGKGQLHAAQKVLPNTLIISLAKREEVLFTPTTPHGIRLDLQTSVGRLIIALRDYAHHFAVSYHKLLRNKGLK
jgi:excinuclease ABC subunit C